MKVCPIAALILGAIMSGCSAPESKLSHKSSLRPKTITLAFMSSKNPDDAGDSPTHKEQFYIYQFNQSKEDVVAMITADPAMSGWKKSEHNRYTLFSNPAVPKTQFTIGSFKNEITNTLDTTKTTLTINEFEKTGS